MPNAAQRWLIGGRVQGVGFRPFVWLLANDLGVGGTVRNCGGHVEIVAAADERRAGLFLQRLLAEHPPIAQPRLMSVEPWVEPTSAAFHILPSTGGPAATVLPDQPVCAACLAEMADPAARRFGYAFIACTQCGPRYTITRRMPFDRANTGMAGFPFCEPCQREYGRPSDRRFHAEVAACPQCGPSLWFQAGEAGFEAGRAALSATVAALRQGAIVAVKGVGGYHLMCDARDDAAVRRLRVIKRRPDKPLAVMVPLAGADGLDVVRQICTPTDAEAGSLRSTERPIVLIARHPGTSLAGSIAPGLPELGVMLPYSPLHHLLTDAFGAPLVATSGNAAGEPIVTDPGTAERRLAPDAFLHYDRPIEQAAEDGVVRVIAGWTRAIRLGRGSAPAERSLPRPVAPMLALGGQGKVTLALGFGNRVVISPHIGDLDNPSGMAAFEATAEALPRLYGVTAATLVCDAHRGYSGTRWAGRTGMPVVKVWHHYAHASAVAGEFTAEARWLCFTWDGAGLGPDNTVWGGEALLGRPGAWRRVATFRRFAPPGGERTAREPWRSAGALAWELGLDWSPDGIDVALAKAGWARRLNSPVTTAVGRLFDAAAAFLHLKHRTSYEGEAAIALEVLASTASGEACPAPLPLYRNKIGLLQADWAPLVPRLLDETLSSAARAAAFQASMAATLIDQAIALRDEHGEFAVGLSGGVFQNCYLAETALTGLAAAGFRAYLPAAVPCNDGGLSFGQVIEAASCAR